MTSSCGVPPGYSSLVVMVGSRFISTSAFSIIVLFTLLKTLFTSKYSMWWIYFSLLCIDPSLSNVFFKNEERHIGQQSFGMLLHDLPALAINATIISLYTSGM